MNGTKRRREQDFHDIGQDSSISLLDALVSPDFEELARQFPDFGRALKEVQSARQAHRETTGSTTSLASVVTQSFTEALTKATLHVYFGLSLIQVPVDHLCPPVPNRFYYVRWIQEDLLPLLITQEHFVETSRLTGTGLDIGTGATCIYPLLFAASSVRSSKLRPFLASGGTSSYQIYGTDVDSKSVETAKQNVNANPMIASLIHVVLVSPSTQQQQQQQQWLQDAANHATPELSSGSWRGPLWTSLDHIPKGHQELDFCMTNPPFYDDNESDERTAHRQGDQRKRTAMTVSEGSYPGGEVGFVLDMILDGFSLYMWHNKNGQPECMGTSIPTPPAWTSCMCGKKTSFTKLKHILEQLLGYSHVCSSEFGPGHMTRWFLAWTFRRPHIRSPLSQIDNWSFSLHLSDVDDDDSTEKGSVCSQIAHRIETFCKETFHACQLTVSRENDTLLIQEDNSAGTPNAYWPGDEVLPETLKQALSKLDPQKRSYFLPPEGHFQLVVTFSSGSGTNAPYVIHVLAYSHTRHGKSIVSKIKSQMEGEVGRSNRRWRRKLKRQQEQEGHHPMDMS